MKRLTNIAKLVKTILERSPETRDDDFLLWLKVLEKVAEYNHIPDFTKTMTLAEFLSIARFTKFPLYHSVSRARRKAQEKFPDLRATEETQAARSELERRYRKFAQNF